MAGTKKLESIEPNGQSLKRKKINCKKNSYSIQLLLILLLIY